MNTEQLYTQIGLSLLSLLGIIPYLLAYKIGSKKDRKEGCKSAIYLYYMSSYPLFLWFIMPFIIQPRIYGLFYLFADIDDGRLIFSILYCIICLAIFFYFCFIWEGKTVKMNLSVTKDTFYAPKRLLTDGIYGKVRHPMISGDMIAHFSFILLLGSLYTLCLFPLYVLYSIIIVKIQTKYSLEPYFSEELKQYRKTTPGYLNKSLSTIVIALLLLMTLNLCLFSL